MKKTKQKVLNGEPLEPEDMYCVLEFEATSFNSFNNKNSGRCQGIVYLGDSESCEYFMILVRPEPSEYGNYYRKFKINEPPVIMATNFKKLSRNSMLKSQLEEFRTKKDKATDLISKIGELGINL